MSAEAPDLNEIGDILSDIIDDNRRAVTVIRHMRAQLSKHKADAHPVDINEIVAGAVELVHGDAVIRNVAVDLELADALPLVAGDRVQLQQVCLNLILNGFDAMQEVPVDGRRLVIQTTRHGESAVCVSVRDTGVGFSEPEPERLFAAFHTTKEAGLGMGLPISRSIVEAHGGKIWAGENPDGGALFKFTVPVVSEF